VTSERPADRLAYSVDEAAAITGLSRDLLHDQMRAGKLAPNLSLPHELESSSQGK
jgi:hypothetical protein